MFKSYYLDDNGNEIILDFHKEKDFSGDWSAVLSAQPSNYCIQAIEPSHIVLVNLKKLEELSSSNLEIMKVYNSILKRKLTYSFQHLVGNMNEKPETRYLKLLDKRPDLLARIHQQDIASYLGITPVSMSRIKKRVVQKYNR
ncbi:MAG: Crp/Fnr family transcriptional regulator [Aureispira sp.]|nr:Crp/Fnr family transcriptional regulator [Aureispira sp.]